MGCNASLPRQHRRRVDGQAADRDGDYSYGALQAAIGPGQPSRGDRQRYRNDDRQRAHSEYRAYAKQQNVEHSVQGIGDLGYGKHEKRGRTRVYTVDKTRLALVSEWLGWFESPSPMNGGV